MPKARVLIGFATHEHSDVGIFTERIEARKYYVDVLRNNRKWQNGERLNDNIDIGADFSFIADPFVRNNIGNFRYVEFGGAKWKVTSVEVQYPRVTVGVGGVYNGND